jgi:hypothetical protein
MLLLVLGFLVMGNIQPLDLVKVGEWGHKDEYWDVKNKNLGFKATNYCTMLLHDQILCEEWPHDGFSRIDYSSRYYIKNYLTGEITYRFENMTKLKLYGANWFDLNIKGFVRDQYGVYIFLLKDSGLVLFDVEEKREYIPGEPLKRPEYIYYIRDYSDGRKVLKHSLTTGKIEEIQFEKLTSNKYYRMLDDIGNNQLKLYDNYYDYILQLNETMTEIISVTKKKIIMENAAEYIIPINENKYIGFKSADWLYRFDEIDGVYFIFNVPGLKPPPLGGQL